MNVVLAGAMFTSGALLVVLGSRLSFLLDDWVFLLYRRGFNADAFLSPDNEHFAAGPVLIYKALLAVFGMSSTLPFHIVGTAFFLLGAGLMFVWLRRRIDPWLALIFTCLILFLGSAYDDTLWFASILFLGSMAFGLGALLALDREDSTGDRIACALLTIAVTFSSLAVPFAIGAFVDVVLRRDWRRIYIVVVPGILYVIWYVGWGHTAENSLSLHNVATTPLFVLNSIAAAIAGLLGLASPGLDVQVPSGLDWGRPLLVALAVLAAWRLHRRIPLPRSFWVVLAIAGAFWILGGLNFKQGRDPASSRYLYPSGVFVLLIAAEALRGIRFSRGVLAVIAAVAAAAIVSNLSFLHGAYNSYRNTSAIERADLGSIEIARDTVSPSFLLDENIADTGYVHVDAGHYLSARDAFGSPAYTPDEILASTAPARLAADKVLVAALDVNSGPAPASARVGGPPPQPLEPAGANATPNANRSCITVMPSRASAPILALPPNGAIARSRGAGTDRLHVRRFSAEEFPFDAGAVSAGHPVEIQIPIDRATQPWQLQVTGSVPATVCGRRV